MRYNLALFILFIMAFSFAFSAWEETLRVYAMDTANRPVEGANITISYQKAQFPIYKNQNFDGQMSLLTNAQGYADFKIYNTVPNVTYELRYYYVEMNYSNLYKKDKINCTSIGDTCHPKEFTHLFTLNTYRVNLNIKDQSDRPIEGALISYNSHTYTTGPTGKLHVTVPQNTDFIIVVDYESSKRTIKQKMEREDKNVDVIFNRYNVKYQIINDKGTAIPAEVILNEEIKNTDENGYVLFEGIIASEINVFVRFENGSREFTEAINQDINKVFVMDMTPPVISNVFHEISKPKNVIFINAKVVDPNTYGTGLRTSSPVKLRYKVGSAGWKTVEMYVTGKDAFQATIPYENELIMYEIEAIDAQENIQKYNGKIDKEGTDKPIDNGTITDPIIIPNDGGEIDFTTILIVAVVIIIIAFIGYKFYSGEL